MTDKKPTDGDAMAMIASSLDEVLNGAKALERKWGFVLLVFPFDAPDRTRINYVSNGKREDVRKAISELVARWEELEHQKGVAIVAPTSET